MLKYRNCAFCSLLAQFIYWYSFTYISLFSIWLKDLPYWTKQCRGKWRRNVWSHCDLDKSSFKILKHLSSCILKAHHSILEVLWFQKTPSKSPEIYINWFASHVVLNGLINVYVSFALFNNYIFWIIHRFFLKTL